MVRGSLILLIPFTVGSLLVLTGCATNAATGKSQFQALSRDQEIQMGMDAKPELTKEFGGQVQNTELQNYVTQVGRSLAATTEADNPSLPWEFTLLESDVINAFALPGGKVFITTGLAKRMSNEAQLAGVLGHEVGHVTARHINDKLVREGGKEFGFSVLGAFIGGSQVGATAAALGKEVASVVLLKYDRGQENQADYLGMRYMSRCFYNPIGQRQVMQILLDASKGSEQPEILATHPDPANRIKNVDKLLAGEFASTQNNPQYQLKEAEFKAKFLSKVAALERTREHATGELVAATAMAGDPEGRVFALGNAGMWCSVCAAGAAGR